jgi:hypothetical protein
MFRRTTTRPFIDAVANQGQLVSFQTAVVSAQTLVAEALTRSEIESVTCQKNCLIQIMSDYINQRKTRVETVNSLKTLSTTIA